jgi:ribosomal protein L2
MRGSEELQRVKGLSLRGVSCEVVLLRGGSGDYQEVSDGCRLVVLVPNGATNQQEHVLVVGRADWQWYRPRGTNAGALPGMRWLSKRRRKILVKGLVARLDT